MQPTDTNTTTDALGTTDLLESSIDGADPVARNLIDREAQALGLVDSRIG